MTEMIETLTHLDDRFGETATKSAIQEIMNIHEAPEDYSERLISFANVLKAGKYKATDYVKAVQYCSYRAMDMKMKDAWFQTFPERAFRDGERKPEGTIDALASLYDKTKLVQSILTQMQIPLNIIMMNERVQAANVLARLMIHSDNERIQMESADKLLGHIAMPESIKVEMDIGVKADETMKDISTSLDKLAQLAQAKIVSGALTPVEVIEL